jgi:sugar-specific transcriptional regulator TrmB
MLQNFGLTMNQGKVYLVIARLGIVTASQISKVSEVRREEVYRIIPKLEKLGLVERVLGTPGKIQALPVEEALSRIIRREQERFDQRTVELTAQKKEFLKHLGGRWPSPPPEKGANFALIMKRDQIINKAEILIRESQREISISTSANLFFNLLSDCTSLLKSALRKSVKLRIIVDMPETMDSLVSTYYPRLQQLRSEIGNYDIRFSDQTSGHFLIGDHMQAMISTSTDLPTVISPYLWTVDKNLVGIIQTNFEETWQSSLRIDDIKTSNLSERVINFVRTLEPRDHVIFIYRSVEAKHNVLFSYIRAGLQNRYATVYVASEETTGKIKDRMKQFGIDVEKEEKTGALQVLDYTDVYIVDGTFEIATTMDKWKHLHSTALRKFKGLRVTGEMSCFFKHGLLEELADYEESLHRVLELPIVAICAYSSRDLDEAKNPVDLYTKLVRAHGAVLFAGIDNTLGKLEIRA